VVVTLPAGESLAVLGHSSDGTWIEVMTPAGQTGWVRATDVTGETGWVSTSKVTGRTGWVSKSSVTVSHSFSTNLSSFPVSFDFPAPPTVRPPPGPSSHYWYPN